MAVAIALAAPLPFDPHGEPATVNQRWIAWLQSLEIFITASGVTNAAQQRAVLLHCAGPQVRTIFNTLPDTGNDYTTAKTKLNEYFAPIQNVPYNRHMFRQAVQKPDETVAQFITRLRDLSIGCDYGDNLEDFLRDQVIEKCTSNLLRKKLLTVKDLKLSKVHDIAQALESSEFQAAAMTKAEDTVNAVQNRPKPKDARPKTRNSRQPQDSRHVPDARQAQSSRYRKQNSRQEQCGKCGMTNHSTEDCKCSKNIRCYKCNRIGHFASMCRSKTVAPRTEEVKHVETTCVVENDHDLLFATSSQVNTLDTHSVTMAGQPVQVLLDSGSTCNTLNEQVAKFLQLTTMNCSRTILPYQSDPIHITKKVFVTVCSGTKTENAEFLVLPGSAVPLIGRSLATKLNLIRLGPPTSISADSTNVLTHTASVLKQYPGITNGIGKLKDFQVKLHIDDTVAPVAHQHSRVPFHLREKVAEEVDKLLKADIIEPVYEPSEWVSRIVTPPKPNDPSQIRLCIDMRNANQAILRTRHPTPTIEDLIHDINGSTVFSKIDLTSGYHQLELHPSSRYITTFSTHCGLFRYKRLNFGVNAAAELFQHTIQTLIADIPGAKNVSDDIIIYGQCQKDHDKALHSVLKRLQERGLTVNASKVVLSKPKLEFFGFIFSDQGIAPAPSKIQALQNAAAPTNPSEVRSFLGMAQYSARFIPNFATISEPLRMLTHKNAKWHFGPKEQKSFDCIRNSLTETANNAYFDPAKHTEILVDASPVGVSAILVQNNRPVVFASRALSPVECRYSQIEREALAVTWSCEHLNVYLQGRPFTCYTDHKPLVGIWQKSNLPLRLARWALRLQSYDIDLKYRPGHDNPADYMSRHPISPSSFRNQAEDYVNFVAKNSAPCAIPLQTLRTATAEDPTLQYVITACEQGYWPRDPATTVDRSTVSSLRAALHELTVQDNLLLKDTKIVIPKSLQSQVIALAHEGHQGITKTKALLRSKVWFAGLDKDTETVIRDCIPCQANSRTVQYAPVEMTPMPNRPWECVSADFCGPLPSGEYLFVVTDQYSKFPIVDIVRSTSAPSIIPRMEKIFSMFSYPEVIKTDNGPPFNSEAWSEYLKSVGCKHRKVTPLWPQANGQVEAFNKPLMKSIRAAHVQGLPWQRELQTFLQAYRVTPHTTTRVSPFSLMFGREPVTKLPQLPGVSTNCPDTDVRKNVELAQQKAKTYLDLKRPQPPVLREGDSVLVRQPHRNKLTTPFDPKPLVVISTKGSMITARRPDNSTITRNVSHFRKVNAPIPPVHNPDGDEYDFDLPDLADPDPPVVPPIAPPVEPVQERGRRPRREVRRPNRLIEEI